MDFTVNLFWGKKIDGNCEEKGIDCLARLVLAFYSPMDSRLAPLVAAHKAAHWQHSLGAKVCGDGHKMIKQPKDHSERCEFCGQLSHECP